MASKILFLDISSNCIVEEPGITRFPSLINLLKLSLLRLVLPLKAIGLRVNSGGA